MANAKTRRPSWSEQLVIKHLQVRLVTTKEKIERFDKLIARTRNANRETFGRMGTRIHFLNELEADAG